MKQRRKSIEYPFLVTSENQTRIHRKINPNGETSSRR